MIYQPQTVKKKDGEEMVEELPTDFLKREDTLELEETPTRNSKKHFSRSVLSSRACDRNLWRSFTELEDGGSFVQTQWLYSETLEGRG